MRRRYSEELLKDIHIRLDKHGLEGITEQEMMVLRSEDAAESTDYLAEKIDQSTAQITDKIDQSTAQIIAKIDQSTAQIMETIDRNVGPIHFWAKVIGSGLWAVAASLIASIIFRACGG